MFIIILMTITMTMTITTMTVIEETRQRNIIRILNMVFVVFFFSKKEYRSIYISFYFWFQFFNIFPIILRWSIAGFKTLRRTNFNSCKILLCCTFLYWYDILYEIIQFFTASRGMFGLVKLWMDSSGCMFNSFMSHVRHWL